MTYSLPKAHQPPPSSLCHIDAPPKREQIKDEGWHLPGTIGHRDDSML